MSEANGSNLHLNRAFDEGFENFFNNESLSDRVLCIYEVEEVECYSLGSGLKRGVKRRADKDNNTTDDQRLLPTQYNFKRFMKQEEIEEIPGEVVFNDGNTNQLNNNNTNTTNNNNNNDIVNNTNQDEIITTDELTTSSFVRPLVQHIKVEEDIAVEMNVQNEQLSQEQDLDDLSLLPSTGYASPLKSDVTSSPSALNSKTPNNNNTIDTSVNSEIIVPDCCEVNQLLISPTVIFKSRALLNKQQSNNDDNNHGFEMKTSLVEQTGEYSGGVNAGITQDKHPASIDNQLCVNTPILTTQTSDFLDCNEDQINPRSLQRRTYTVEKKVLKETKVYVHSIILAAKSQFFKFRFSTSGMKESTDKEVRIEVRKGETESILIMLRCFYNRNFVDEHSLNDVINVCALAMQYSFDGLISKCLEVFAIRAEAITGTEDFNRVNVMVLKIQNDLTLHKEQCFLVMSKCRPFLVDNFYPLDECLEKTPCKFFMLRLEAMNLFLDLQVQSNFESPHGNLFLYAIQRWIRAHVIRLSDIDDYSKQYKLDIISFIEKLLDTVNMISVTGDFLTNVMNYEISPFNIWPGYKEWYIRALQNFVHKSTSSVDRSTYHRQYPSLTRNREVRFARQEKNADIFSMYPVILNGFEIGIYLRVREDRKVHMLCKCKNFQLNKVGFDKSSLSFSLKGILKLNTNSNLWKEPFPKQFPGHPPSFSSEKFTFSYKQSTMCLQMYALCKLSPAVYNIAKRSGFLIEFDIQQSNI